MIKMYKFTNYHRNLHFISMELTNNVKILLLHLVDLNGWAAIVDFSFLWSSFINRTISIIATDLIHSFFTYLSEQQDNYTYSYHAITYKKSQIIFFNYFKMVYIHVYSIRSKLLVNPYLPNAHFLYSLKKSENLTVLWLFSDVFRG